MLPGRIVEDAVDRQRQIALCRVDPVSRCDQGGDLGDRLVEERRIGIEDEIFPSKEPFADLDLVGFDFHPSGHAKARHHLGARAPLLGPVR
ncbi:hypothetical protein D3C87_1984330 [compost metagenome]